MDYTDKGEPVTTCMDVYKLRIQYNGSPENLKLIIVVIGDFNNKEMLR